METRQRRPEPRPATGTPEGDGDGSAALQQRARDLLTAADRAIERVLSQDSEQFLRNSVQRGGQ